MTIRRTHLRTRPATERDFFITDDLALLTMCRRLRDEHEIPMEATSVGVFAQVDGPGGEPNV